MIESTKISPFTNNQIFINGTRACPIACLKQAYFPGMSWVGCCVNFTNILWAAFAPKSFHQKITNSNCKHLKAVQITLAWLSISPIFYKQLFHTKVLCAPFMCLQFGFVIFWQKDFGTKAAHKMLVKLTPVLLRCNHIFLMCRFKSYP